MDSRWIFVRFSIDEQNKFYQWRELQLNPFQLNACKRHFCIQINSQKRSTEAIKHYTAVGSSVGATHSGRAPAWKWLKIEELNFAW